jgi:hypothetical protein
VLRVRLVIPLPAALVTIPDDFLYPIRPGNDQLECTNGCKNSGRPGACLRFCDCIYDEGNPLNRCLDECWSARAAGTDTLDEGKR